MLSVSKITTSYVFIEVRPRRNRLDKVIFPDAEPFLKVCYYPGKESFVQETFDILRGAK